MGPLIEKATPLATGLNSGRNQGTSVVCAFASGGTGLLGRREDVESLQAPPSQSL
jgi:hypothetical protein